MSKARLICGLSTAKILLVLLGVIALSSLTAIFISAPKIEKVVLHIVDKYDSFLPEIRIRDGHTSVREKQPYYVDVGDPEVAIVIDTRDGMQKQAMDYLKEVSGGAVLTRDTLIMKNRADTRIISLKDMPDIEINSEALRDLLGKYWPLAMRLAAVLIVLYFLVVKPLQVLIFALVPYFGARFFNVPLTYGEAVKIAGIGIVLPVLLDFILSTAQLGVQGGMMLYFAVYSGVLVVACVDLVRGTGKVEMNPPTIKS